MKNIFKALAYSSIIFFFSCSGSLKKKEAKDFYFPYQNFVQKMAVYKYVNESDSADCSFWEMRTEAAGPDTFLYTQIFDGSHALLETMKEKIGDKSSTMRFYRLNLKDTSGVVSLVECKVMEDTVFKWKYAPNDSCRWKVQYTEQGVGMEMLKSRMFTGDSVLVTFEGKDNISMEFYDRFTIDSLTKKVKDSPPFSYFIQSYYSQGIGLISYKVSLPGRKRKDYLLKRIN